MNKIKLIYDKAIGNTSYKLIDMDTGRDIVQDNHIESMTIQATPDDFYILLRLRPDHFEVEVDGEKVIKTRRAKLK